MKIIVAAIWLIAAFLLRGNPAGRKVFAFLGSIVALVHLGAMGGGALLKAFTGRTSVEGGVNMAGFLAGAFIGLILGLFAGSFVSRNEALYWLVQVAAVAFLMFLPLFRW